MRGPKHGEHPSGDSGGVRLKKQIDIARVREGEERDRSERVVERAREVAGLRGFVVSRFGSAFFLAEKNHQQTHADRAWNHRDHEHGAYREMRDVEKQNREQRPHDGAG
ncbi:MAG TPA: hypothetical protein VGA10_04540, partial [Thermoanaerobaculia bacterium]